MAGIDRRLQRISLREALSFAESDAVVDWHAVPPRASIMTPATRARRLRSQAILA